MYLPYDVNSMRGLVRTLPSAYGRATQSLVRPVRAGVSRPACSHAFSLVQDASMVMPSVKEEAAENKDEFGDL